MPLNDCKFEKRRLTLKDNLVYNYPTVIKDEGDKTVYPAEVIKDVTKRFNEFYNENVVGADSWYRKRDSGSEIEFYIYVPSTETEQQFNEKMNSVLSKYGDQVSFTYRKFPKSPETYVHSARSYEGLAAPKINKISAFNKNTKKNEERIEEDYSRLEVARKAFKEKYNRLPDESNPADQEEMVKTYNETRVAPEREWYCIDCWLTFKHPNFAPYSDAKKIDLSTYYAGDLELGRQTVDSKPRYFILLDSEEDNKVLKMYNLKVKDSKVIGTKEDLEDYLDQETTVTTPIIIRDSEFMTNEVIKLIKDSISHCKDADLSQIEGTLSKALAENLDKFIATASDYVPYTYTNEGNEVTEHHYLPGSYEALKTVLYEVLDNSNISSQDAVRKMKHNIETQYDPYYNLMKPGMSERDKAICYKKSAEGWMRLYKYIDNVIMKGRGKGVLKNESGEYL